MGYRIEILTRLPGQARRDVDALIFDVWTAESNSDRDVDVLVSEGATVIDPLDQISKHVLVRSDSNQLVGYGRVAIVTSESQLVGRALSEINIPDAHFPLAYVSRMVVAPSSRGRGIASMIHAERIKVAKEHSIDSIYGWAVGDKPRSAFSRLGFEEIDSRIGFETAWYSTRRKSRLMRLNLAPHKNEYSISERSIGGNF